MSAVFATDPHQKKHEHEARYPTHDVLYWKCPCPSGVCTTAAVACLTCFWQCESVKGYANACLAHQRSQN